MAEQKIMDEMESQMTAFNLILHSGDARNNVHEAMDAMKVADWATADAKLAEAEESLRQAHQAQTELLQEFSRGTKIEIQIIMVHAQDHLMTTMTLKEVAVELMDVYKKIA